MDNLNEDRRLSDQDTAIEEAFVAATLPEEDRRAEPESEVPPTVPSVISNEEISFIRERPDGKKTNALGSILE